MRMRLAIAGVLALTVCQAAMAQQAPQLPSSMDFGDPTENLAVIKVAPGLSYVMGRNVSSR
jgi:hypothetical protein